MCHFCSAYKSTLAYCATVRAFILDCLASRKPVKAPSPRRLCFVKSLLPPNSHLRPTLLLTLMKHLGRYNKRQGLWKPRGPRNQLLPARRDFNPAHPMQESSKCAAELADNDSALKKRRATMLVKGKPKPTHVGTVAPSRTRCCPSQTHRRPVGPTSGENGREIAVGHMSTGPRKKHA